MLKTQKSVSLQSRPDVGRLSARRRGRQVHGRGRRRRGVSRRGRRGRRWGCWVGVLLDERVEPTREARRSATRRRRRHAGRRTAHSRSSTRSTVSAVAGVSAIRGRSSHGLMPGGGSSRGRRAATVLALTTTVVAVASVAITVVPSAVAAIAIPIATITGPGGRTTGRTALVVAVIVPRTPRSRAARRPACPGTRVASAARAIGNTGSGTCFDARRGSASTTEFLHELLR